MMSQPDTAQVKGRPVCAAEGGHGGGTKKDKHKQKTNTQHKQNNNTNFGGREEYMCSFMEMFLRRSVHLLFSIAGRRDLLFIIFSSVF